MKLNMHGKKSLFSALLISFISLGFITAVFAADSVQLEDVVVRAQHPVVTRDYVIFDDDVNWDGGSYYAYPGSAMVVIDAAQHKQGMFSARLEWAPDCWSGCSLCVGSMNLTEWRKNGTLQFWVKGKTGKESGISISMTDSNIDGAPFHSDVALSKYCKLSKEWTLVQIPMADFKDKATYWDEPSQSMKNGTINWKEIMEISYYVGPTKWNGNMTVWVDDVRIIPETKSTKADSKLKADSEIIFFDDGIGEGGASYSYPSGSSLAEIVDGQGMVKGTSALHCVFDIHKYSGVEVVLGSSYDLSKLKETGAIEFWVKGTVNTPEFYVGLANSRDNGKPVVVAESIDKYIKINNSKWQKVVIPLNIFPSMGTYWDADKNTTIPGEFLWNDVLEVTLYAGPSWGGDSDFLVDKIKILGTYVPDRNELLKKLRELYDNIIYVGTAVKKAKAGGVDVTEASTQYNNSVLYYKGAVKAIIANNNKLAFAYYKGGKNSSNNAFYASMESRPVEDRGVWIQYWSLSTPEEVSKMVEKLASANFNYVALEAYVLGGKVVWPSKVGSQFEQFGKWDPLKQLNTELKKNGIKLYAWFHIMRAGNSSPLFTSHPDWIEWEKPITEFDASTTYWVCPARKEYREYLKGFIDELANNYPGIGFQYDYIRMPESPKHSCYYCKGIFQAETGINPWDDAVANDVEKTMMWNIFRENLITDMVKDISTYIRKKHPEMQISAAVWPLNNHGFLRNTVIQPWENWVDNQYLDSICPMEYETSLDGFERLLKGTEKRVNGRISLLHGMGQYLIPNTFETMKQIQLAHDYNTDGTCMFALNTLTDSDFTALKKGAYKNKAIQPSERTAIGITAQLMFIKNKALFVKDSKLANLAQAAVAPAQAAEKVDFTKGKPAMEELRAAVNVMTAHVSTYKGGKNASLVKDTEYLQKLVKQRMYSRKIIELTEPVQKGKLAIVPLPTLRIPKVKTPPVIDGKLDDAIYKTAAVAGNFWYYDATGHPEKEIQTTAYVCYDDTNLYLGIYCAKSEATYKMVAGDGGKTWEDDSIELFFDPKGDGKDFYQMGTSVSGGRFANKGDISWTRKTVAGKNGWVLEMAIPFALLGGTPTPGTQWRANICRNDYVLGTPHTNWSTTYGSFLTPSRFGKFIFE